MKRILSMLLCLMLLTTGALAETLIIDLASATDLELADAAAKIAAEQKARIKTTLTLDTTEATLNKGKQLKLTATVAGLPEGAAQPKLVWATSDKAIATVQNGNVNAVDAGVATITCTITLESGAQLTAQCKVSVIIPITSVQLEKKSVFLNVGETFTPAFKVKPQKATNHTLAYTSSDETVATVSADGVITAVGPGKCTVTATSTDGTNESATAKVSVSPFAVENTTYTVTEKAGSTFSIGFYGKSLSEVKFNITGSNYANVERKFVPGKNGRNQIKFTITPLKAGTVKITITDRANDNNKLTLKVVIDNKAVYSKKSYPAIQYSDAFRYPDKYKGRNVSFSGTVLQVIPATGQTQYRISSKGRYDNVVYVILPDSQQTIPLLEDDKVTVYGTYQGTVSYEAINGATITIPMVYAERINLQKK